MSEFLHTIVNLQSPFNMVVLIVLIGSVAGVLSSIAKQFRKYACHRQDIDFKRELVDRGLPADEIERIIAVQSPAGGDKPSTVHCQQYLAGDD
jgi:hypothetical protein